MYDDEVRLVNLTQELVEYEVKSRIPTATMRCKCNKCVTDVMALALNSVNSHFITSERGEILSRVSLTNMKGSNDIMIAILQAIHKVGENPMHPLEEVES